MDDFFELYDCLIDSMDADDIVTGTLCGDQWTAVCTADRFGMAMTTPGSTAPKLLPDTYEGLSLRQVAQGCKSWNLTEAGFGLAAVNACCNTPQRLEQLQAYEPFDRYCTDGLDLRGKHIGLVGHLNMPGFIREQAASVRILERNPQTGDYPDSACDWLLPQCDVVIITASTLVNKTLPHLLELSRKAYTILAGPSCPLCPALLELGIDRMAGLVITDRQAMADKIRSNTFGPPYPLGKPFLLKRDTP